MKITSIAGLIGCLLVVSACAGKTPATLGLTDGKLSPCPSRPNCVSSMTISSDHTIEPFRYSQDKPTVMAALTSVINSYKRASIITQTDNYVHVEFRTMLFRFVDDVEFYFSDTDSLIHIRSASRLGYSDLGVNRKRMERLRTQLKSALENN